MSQFRVLYRQFLFRMVDLELLSAHAQGDSGKLLGQFAALMIFFSALQGLIILVWDRRMPPQALLVATWSIEHFLIATTMLAVGLFAVLSWDSTFPDRLDVLVLAPLPVRARTLFLAKVAASASALGVTVVALNAFTGLALPFALAQGNGGILDLLLSLDLYQPLVAYWITMISAGGFIYCSVLCVQGVAAQLLPRRFFLTVSAFLQMAAFCLVVCVYFLQPSLTTPKALTAAQNQQLLHWLPSYWFLALFQELNGSSHPALAPLARRALAGVIIAALGACAVFLLSYFRTLRKIVDEPDIAPGFRGGNWLPGFGSPLQTALVRFSIRTLLRSRRHRVILAFYLGIAFALVVFYVKTPLAQKEFSAGYPLNVPLLASTVVMMCFWVAGIRVVFSMPLELRANWIFRVTPVPGGGESLVANRRSLIVLAVAPVWVASATLLLSLWTWRPVAGHLVVLGLLGLILADVCLHSFQKIPFTCSYLPGKSQAHLAFLAAMFLTFIVDKGVRLEQRALEHPASYARMLAILGLVAICVRWRAVAQAKSPEGALQFEDEAPPVIFALDLHHERAMLR
jgi:hypothetical protein